MAFEPLTTIESEIAIPSEMLTEPERGSYSPKDQSQRQGRFIWSENFKVQSYAFAKWYKVLDLVNVLEEVKEYELENYQGKRAALTKILGTGKKLNEIPINNLIRFPEHQLFVCDAIGSWKTDITSLRINLSYVERDESNGQGKQDYNRHCSLFETIDSMLTKIRSKENLIDRTEFESFMELTWLP